MIALLAHYHELEAGRLALDPRDELDRALMGGTGPRRQRRRANPSGGFEAAILLKADLDAALRSLVHEVWEPGPRGDLVRVRRDDLTLRVVWHAAVLGYSFIETSEMLRRHRQTVSRRFWLGIDAIVARLNVELVA